MNSKLRRSLLVVAVLLLAIAETIRRGVAGKPMIRAYERLYPRLYPFDHPFQPRLAVPGAS